MELMNYIESLKYQCDLAIKAKSEAVIVSSKDLRKLLTTHTLFLNRLKKAENIIKEKKAKNG